MKVFEADESGSGKAAADAAQAANAGGSPPGGPVSPDCAGKDQTNGPGRYQFVLYVAGNLPNSERAIVNLRRICADHIPGQHDFQIVDVLRDPQKALAENIWLTPMLVKVSPGPIRRVAGALNFTQPILRALGLLTQDGAEP